MVRARLKKWGGSLGVVINAAEVRKRGLREGMEIEFEPRQTGLNLEELRLALRDITKAQWARILRSVDEDDGWHDDN